MTNELYKEIIAAVVEDIENVDIENYWQHETTLWSESENGKFYRVVYDVLSADLYEDRESNYRECTYRVQVTKVLAWDGQNQKHISIEFDRKRLLIEGVC